MLFDPETANHLKPWLIRNLEPICDAEPGALADYVLALLKHNAPEAELRKELVVQLEEFLEKECASFVDTLFTVLRTKSYLPYSATPSSSYPSSSTSPDAGIPIPLDGLLNPSLPPPERGRKRGIDQDEYDTHGPPKGPRLNNDGQFSRYGRNSKSSWGSRGDHGGRMDVNGRPDFMDGGMAGMDGGGVGGMNGRGQNYRPPERRGICRDYYNNGYCARGAFCKYSHGEDAVVPTQLFPIAGGAMPFMPMMGPAGMPFPMAAGGGGAYDPHERMDMRPVAARSVNGGPSVLPRTDEPDTRMGQKPGELPVIQDLTPQIPIQDVSPHNAGEGFRNQQRPSMDGVVPTYDVPPHMPDTSNGGMGSRPYPMNGRGQPRGGRGRGGIFSGDAHSFRPEKRNDKTLVVEKIPEDKLTLAAVNDWFSKFGTVTNVAVDTPSAKALVSFSSHDEAYKAWKSEEAVFGNRFVKVFWHRPMEGHGQVGQRMLAASAPLVAQRSAVQAAPGSSTAPSEGSPAPQTPTSTAPVSRKPSTASAASALAAKQKLLEQQIAEQKSLMAKLSTASPEEKKDIMARLRKLNEEMKPSAAPSATSQSPPPAATSAAQPQRAGSTPRIDEQERAERERLDKELELHHASTTGEGEEESTEELKAKLEKLKAEAARLGITETSEPTAYPSTTYRPYRGRGRGRSFFRSAMRGGPPRSMKLDLRPKKLLVKGAPSESLQAVRDWYETTGQVESVETTEGGDIVVAFRSRGGAEQGLAKGSHIAAVGPVQVSWYTERPANAGSAAPSKSPAPSGSSGQPSKEESTTDHGAHAHAHTEDAEDSHMHEEVDAGGWGGDDDAFGMI